MSITLVPSIDLRDGKVVRLQQGDYARQVSYGLDPARVAISFANSGATWMHVVDLDGAKQGRPVQTDLIAKIVGGTTLKVQAGGGIRSQEDIDRLLQAGVARIVIGTQAVEHWDWFESMARNPIYDGRLVLALDAKDGMVATRAWTHTSTLRATDIAAKVSDWPLAGILYTDVAKDGMLQGPNLEQTRQVAEAGKIPVIASGGVGTIEHVRDLAKLPIWGAIVGRSLYEGKVDLKEAIAAANYK